MYTRWYADKLWMLMPAQAIVGRLLASFREFPKREKSTTCNIDRILDKCRRPVRTDRFRQCAQKRAMSSLVHRGIFDKMKIGGAQYVPGEQRGV
jgi:hypothetical protein